MLWTAILLAAAIALAAIRRATAQRHSTSTHTVAGHAVIGLLLMAGLQLATIVGTATPSPAPDVHGHDGASGPPPIAMIASLAAVGYGVLSVFVVARVRDWGGRIPVIAMTAVVLMMAGSIIE